MYPWTLNLETLLIRWSSNNQFFLHYVNYALYICNMQVVTLGALELLSLVKMYLAAFGSAFCTVIRVNAILQEIS